MATNICEYILSKDTTLKLKRHQLSISNQLARNRGVIAVHSVGTGKTLAAISTAQCLLNKNMIKRVIVVTPTSLQKNFIKQSIQYGLSQKQIDTNYVFYTIQGITNAIDNKNINNPANCLIIIDEAHNLRTLNGSRFNAIYNYAKKAHKVLLLTATPLINYSSDIINLISLTSGNKPISIYSFEAMMKNKDRTEFKKYIKNIFNFYLKKSSTKNSNFPSKKIIDIFLPMSHSYLNIYKKIEKGEASKISDFSGKNLHVFYNGLRRASNIIEDKSDKVNWIKKKIISEPNVKYLIFSHFINMGIVPVMKWLDSVKIPYAHITGDLTITEREDAVIKYNSDKIKILFISKAGSEGLDLKSTRYIIIMESTWNENSIEQIIGRGVRYKSHVALPKSKHKVTIYRLYTIKPEEYEHLNKIKKNHLLKLNKKIMMSVDFYLRNYSWTKQQKLDIFQKLLIKYSK
jgi:superfamily II DNA or RNA helicase